MASAKRGMPALIQLTVFSLALAVVLAYSYTKRFTSLSHVVLGLIYYLVFTPFGLIMRLFRYDPLARRFEAQTASYWQTRSHPKTVARYFRQD